MKRLLAGCAASLLSLIGAEVRADIVVSYSDFADLSAVQLNSVAAGTTDDLGGKVLRLTYDLYQSGSAFLRTPIGLLNSASFSSAFSFRISHPEGDSDADGQGADGIVFALQRQSSTAGGTGGGIGYSGITPSIGIEFDTWNNGSPWDNNGNHVGVDLNGSVNSVAEQPVAKRLNDGDIWYAWVDYNGATQQLEVRLSLANSRPTSPLLSYHVDLASQLGITQSTDTVFAGFTSGTGAAGGYHDIRSWALTNNYNPNFLVPLPGSLWGGLGLGGVLLAIRSIAARRGRS